MGTLLYLETGANEIIYSLSGSQNDTEKAVSKEYLVFRASEVAADGSEGSQLLRSELRVLFPGQGKP